MTGRAATGRVAVVFFVLTVVAANWFVQHVGQGGAGGAPHTIPVGFGQRAPSGVLWAGLAFTARDVVQSTLGKRHVLAAIGVGAALSYVVAPSLALASAVAFLLSECLDLAVYTPLVVRGRVLAGVLLSNAAGLVVDTLVFLRIAFGSVDLWQGQVLGKAWMTLLAVALLLPARRALLPAPA